MQGILARRRLRHPAADGGLVYGLKPGWNQRRRPRMAPGEDERKIDRPVGAVKPNPLQHQ
jgi:hypothetical protein